MCVNLYPISSKGNETCRETSEHIFTVYTRKQIPQFSQMKTAIMDNRNRRSSLTSYCTEIGFIKFLGTHGCDRSDCCVLGYDAM
jgi:hypothetical protein